MLTKPSYLQSTHFTDTMEGLSPVNGAVSFLHIRNVSNY